MTDTIESKKAARDAYLKDCIARNYFKPGFGEFKNATGLTASYSHTNFLRELSKTRRDIEAAAKSKFVAESQALITLLKSETESLRVQYVELTEKWATEDFTGLEGVAAKPHPKYDEYVKPAQKGVAFGQDYEGQKRYRKACEARELAKKIVASGRDEYVAREVAAAEEHYQDSIVKLALRIEKKGLNQKNITVKTSHLGVNIETVLTDGIQTVRAWTIIAAGPIQRPHYRYLVK